MHRHHHGAHDGATVVARRPALVLSTLLALIAAAIAFGAVAMWPHGTAAGLEPGSASLAVDGTTFPMATVQEISPTCRGGGDSDVATAGSTCETATVTIEDGARAGERVDVQLQGPLAAGGVRAGDQLRLMIAPVATQAPDVPGGVAAGVSVFGVVRTAPFLLWALVSVYDTPLLNLLSYDDIAAEIVRTVCSGIGLVLAIPITTAIAVALVPPYGRDGRPDTPTDVSGEDMSKID